MVANNKIDTLLLGIIYFCDSFYATIKSNNEFHIRFLGIVDTLKRYAVSLVVSIGYVIVYIVGKSAQKLINQSNSGGTVHIVVSINKNSLFVTYSFFDTLHGKVHVRIQKRIVQVSQIRIKEIKSLIFSTYTPLQQQLYQVRVYR